MQPGSFYFDITASGPAVFLGRTESKLMEIAWSRSSLTVKSALAHLGPDQELAYTTVMTILNRLTDKQLLSRTRDGRNFVYRTALTRDQFLKERVATMLDCLTHNFPNHCQEHKA